MSRIRNVAIAISTVTCGVLLSFGWSEQAGVSLSVDSAQARVGHPYTPASAAGVTRRHYRRAAAAGAATAAGAAAAGATAPYYAGAADSPGLYVGPPHYGHPVHSAYAGYYGGAPTIGDSHYAVRAPWYGYDSWGDYAARSGVKCTPGGPIKLDDGRMYTCQ